MFISLLQLDLLISDVIYQLLSAKFILFNQIYTSDRFTHKYLVTQVHRVGRKAAVANLFQQQLGRGIPNGVTRGNHTGHCRVHFAADIQPVESGNRNAARNGDAVALAVQ